MVFLEKPQGKRVDLVTALQAQQQASAARVKNAAAKAPGSFMHDPYTKFTGPKGAGSWQPLTLQTESDVFTP